MSPFRRQKSSTPGPAAGASSSPQPSPMDVDTPQVGLTWRYSLMHIALQQLTPNIQLLLRHLSIAQQPVRMQAAPAARTHRTASKSRMASAVRALTPPLHRQRSASPQPMSIDLRDATPPAPRCIAFSQCHSLSFVALPDIWLPRLVTSSCS